MSSESATPETAEDVADHVRASLGRHLHRVGHDVGIEPHELARAQGRIEAMNMVLRLIDDGPGEDYGDHPTDEYAEIASADRAVIDALGERAEDAPATRPAQDSEVY